MNIQFSSAQLSMANLNAKKNIISCSYPLQIDSNVFIAYGVLSSDFKNYLLKFNGYTYDSISFTNFPNTNLRFGAVDFSNYEKSNILLFTRNGGSGPYNQIIYSLDYGKSFSEYVHIGAWDLEVVGVYNNLVYLKYTEPKNKDKYKYMMTQDTFKTFVELDWENQNVAFKSIYRDEKIWRFYKIKSVTVNGMKGTNYTGYNESKDNGKTWNAISLPIKFNYNMLNKDTFYSFSKFKVYWSYDAGQHWDSIPHYMWGGNAFDIWFSDKNTGYAIMGAKKLFKTNNGGLDWELTYTFDCHVFYIDPWDKNYILFHTLGYSGQTNPDFMCIYRTTNGLKDPTAIKKIEIPNSSDNKSAFNLYPNPANQSINLQTPNGANAALSIYNLMGQIQYQNPAQAPGTIDISLLATGLYIFELRQGAVVYRQRIEIVK